MEEVNGLCNNTLKHILLVLSENNNMRVSILGKFVSFDQFTNAVTSNRYPAPSQEQYNNFNKHARTLGKINDVQEAAMALAQLLHESDGLRAKREYACAQSNCPSSYRTPGCDMPGRFYYGRLR